MTLAPTPYEIGGKPFLGYLADGSRGGRVPGIVVAHEGPGITSHTRSVTSELGELGFVAFALDLYGEPDVPVERAMELVRELRADRATLRSRTRAAFDLLATHPRVDPERLAAVGYCFGGAAVIELARGGADVSCVVGFHAGLDLGQPGEAAAIRGKLLLCMGDEDPIITAEQRAAFTREMTAGGVDWQMIVYGGVGHSFTNPGIDAYGYPGFRYDSTADRRSWRAMLDLFEEVWGP